MDATHLVDAFSTSLCALLGMWAAVVRRHWFLRFAVVGGLLALALLVPAYEVVIEFGVAAALIWAGVRLSQRPLNLRVRWSLETALLAMVVVGVSAAVVGAAPTYGVEQWIHLVGIGITISYFALACLWIVCGQSRPPVRFAVGAAGVALYVVVMFVGSGILYATTVSGPGAWRGALERWFTRDYAKTWMAGIVPSVLTGVGILLVILSLARLSGWFGAAGSGGRRITMLAARGALCVLAVAVAAPNFYLLYKLCDPPALPAVTIPVENAYDDFVAAGRQPGIDYAVLRQQPAAAWSDQDLARLIAEFQPAYNLIDAGLGKRSWVTIAYSDSPQADADRQSLINVGEAMELRFERLRRLGRWNDLVELSCRGIQFGHESSRGHRTEYALEAYFEAGYLARIEGVLGALTSRQCKLLVERLLELDRRREPIDAKLERDHVYVQRASWGSHLRSLIRQWNGSADSLEGGYLRNRRYTAAFMQLVITDAALQAYWLDHGTPPESLAALVPAYLPAVPVDPFDNRSIKYVCERGVYRVYSVFHDGKDDGGVSLIAGSHADFVKFGPHLPPVPLRVREAAGSAAMRLWEVVTRAATAAGAAAPATSPR